MKIKKRWNVFGWLNGADHEANKPYDYTVQVRAVDEIDADIIGDKKLTETYGECDVIQCEEIIEKKK